MKFQDAFSKVGWSAITVVCVFIGTSVFKFNDFMAGVRTDVAVIRSELTGTKKDFDEMKKEIGGVKGAVNEIDKRVIILESKRR